MFKLFLALFLVGFTIGCCSRSFILIHQQTPRGGTTTRGR